MIEEEKEVKEKYKVYFDKRKGEGGVKVESYRIRGKWKIKRKPEYEVE